MPYRLDILTRPPVTIEAPNAAATIAETKQEIIPKLAQLAVGQRLQGEILSHLQDGTYTVRVADIVTRMRLPEGSKVGESLPFRLVSSSPRPTFLLDQANIPHDLPPGAASDTVDVTSPQKRAIAADILTQHEDLPTTYDNVGKGPPKPAIYVEEQAIEEKVLPDSVQQGLTRPGSEKITGTNTGATNQIQTNAAKDIAGTKTDVGSHINDAPAQNSSAPTVLSNAAKLITQVLHQEPQNIRTDLIGQSAVLNSAADLKDTGQTAKALENKISSSGLFYESHLAEWTQGLRSTNDILKEPQAQTQTIVKTNEDNAALLNVNKNLTQLIHQQLSVLEQQSIHWQGELFPGQKMEWNISKDKSHNKMIPEETNDSWQSVVHFELPHLGSISATLQLQGNQIAMRLRADQTDTVSALKLHVPELASALELSGSTLQILTVNQHDEG
ncbi:flagellar hook-length control protein FliK [Undibacterium sp. SXout7W]|uniref:flagellar hook-length control protein FliK n=1 Tax=Undibacterium sp. SXout7W TaxID=3413049 RepID=UPI003BF023C7